MGWEGIGVDERVIRHSVVGRMTNNIHNYALLVGRPTMAQDQWQ